MTLAVLVTERLTPGMRGVLSRWFFEVNPGIYVGTLSRRVRETVWGELSSWVETHDIGYALLIEPADNEQGFRTSTVGASRYECTDYLGLSLVTRHVERSRSSADEEEFPVGW